MTPANAVRQSAPGPKPSDLDSEITNAVAYMADEHMAAFLSHVGDDLRQTAVDRFNAIGRAAYVRLWQRTGQQFGTPLHRAALWEERARDSDALFRSALANGALVGTLTALADHCERDWRRAHLALLGESERRHA